MNARELETHVKRDLELLQREFQAVAPERVVEIGLTRLQRLRAEATVYDFIPTLVYRQTREELRASDDELHQSA